MPRRRYKHRKRRPEAPPSSPPSPSDEEARARLVLLRDEIRPELERIAEANRPKLDPEPWRPTLRERLRNFWTKKRNERRLRRTLRAMGELKATPPAPSWSRFKESAERYLRNLKKLENEVAEGRPKFLAQAELDLDDLRAEVEQARVAADRWEDWARQAVLDRRDDLAKEALKLRDEWHRQADAWQSRLEGLRRPI